MPTTTAPHSAPAFRWMRIARLAWRRGLCFLADLGAPLLKSGSRLLRGLLAWPVVLRPDKCGSAGSPSAPLGCPIQHRRPVKLGGPSNELAKKSLHFNCLRHAQADQQNRVNTSGRNL